MTELRPWSGFGGLVDGACAPASASEQIALTWPTLGIRQTSGESGKIWQTLSAESVPAMRPVSRNG